MFFPLLYLLIPYFSFFYTPLNIFSELSFSKLIQYVFLTSYSLVSFLLPSLSSSYSLSLLHILIPAILIPLFSAFFYHPIHLSIFPPSSCFDISFNLYFFFHVNTFIFLKFLSPFYYHPIYLCYFSLLLLPIPHYLVCILSFLFF